MSDLVERQYEEGAVLQVLHVYMTRLYNVAVFGEKSRSRPKY